MKVTNTIGPFNAMLTNVNTQMGLPGHTHFVQVYLTYQATGKDGADPRAFPAFKETTDVVEHVIRGALRRPLRNVTNEMAAMIIFKACLLLEHATITKWGGSYKLIRLDFDVRGVHDDIGHSDQYTRYTVTP